MDWGADYYTFSDTNIEYIWRFLKVVHERGWLYKGHRSTQWCPRCGTSISQHEVYSGEYQELDHPSLYVRFPLADAEGQSLVIWTTTPWTLPANVAAAVRPDAEYGRTADGDWYAVERRPDAEFVERVLGQELVGRPYHGPFDDLAAAAEVEHRVIPWDDVSLDEGTGIVHIAPGAGTEDFELGRVHDLPVLVPIDESGLFYDNYGALAGIAADAVEEPVVASLRERGLLVEAGRIVHRYPTCWRCKTPLLFRVVDDWFISAEEIRQPMLDANATVEWTPAFYSKRMDDWLRNMGDWNISRKRYFGLPLPIYPCACGHVTVVGSRAELEQRAVRGLDGLRELHRPWIDDVVIACDKCGEEVTRVPEVGDAWLDAGIVPLSTLGWDNEAGYVPGGYAHRRRGGPDDGRPAGPRVLGEVVPRRLGVGDARADPAVVLRHLLHVGDARRPLAVPPRADVREAPRRDRARDASFVGECHQRRRGARPDGRRRHALALLRAGAEPEPALRLRPGPRDKAPAADVLELCEVLRRLRERLAGGRRR